LKAKLESSTSHYGFKRLIPGGFNMDFIGSTCTALPGCSRRHGEAAQVEFESKT
jgi:hypothetical protein